MIELNFNRDSNNINIKAKSCENSKLNEYADFEYFANLCKEGCPNYNSNYTCPPYSPTFEEYAKNYKSSYIIVMYMNVNQKTNMLESHKYLRNILSDLLIHIEKEVSGLLTEGGRCLKCSECLLLHDINCKYPEEMRFSMEAMGIDLSKLSKDLLNHSMMWSNDENENTYCTVIGSVMFNDFDEKAIDKIIYNKVYN